MADYLRPTNLNEALQALAHPWTVLAGCRGEWLQVINAAKGNVWIDRWCAKEEGCRG